MDKAKNFQLNLELTQRVIDRVNHAAVESDRMASEVAAGVIEKIIECKVLPDSGQICKTEFTIPRKIKIRLQKFKDINQPKDGIHARLSYNGLVSWGCDKYLDRIDASEIDPEWREGKKQKLFVEIPREILSGIHDRAKKLTASGNDIICLIILKMIESEELPAGAEKLQAYYRIPQELKKRFGEFKERNQTDDDSLAKISFNSLFAHGAELYLGEPPARRAERDRAPARLKSLVKG